MRLPLLQQPRFSLWMAAVQSNIGLFSALFGLFQRSGEFFGISAIEQATVVKFGRKGEFVTIPCDHFARKDIDHITFFRQHDLFSARNHHVERHKIGVGKKYIVG